MEIVKAFVSIRKRVNPSLLDTNLFGEIYEFARFDRSVHLIEDYSDGLDDGILRILVRRETIDTLTRCLLKSLQKDSVKSMEIINGQLGLSLFAIAIDCCMMNAANCLKRLFKLSPALKDEIGILSELSASEGSIMAFKVLLDQDEDEKIDLSRLLRTACWRGDIQIAELLLSRGARLDDCKELFSKDINELLSFY